MSEKARALLGGWCFFVAAPGESIHSDPSQAAPSAWLTHRGRRWLARRGRTGGMVRPSPGPGRAVVVHAKRSQSLQIGTRAQEGEIMPHPQTPSYSGTTTPVAPEHQVGQLSLDFGPSSLVTLLPGRVFLSLPLVLQRRFMRMEVDRSTLFRVGTLGALCAACTMGAKR